MSDTPTPKAQVDAIIRIFNGGRSETREAVIDALANEHPTLLGQFAKAVGTAVMRRVTYEWRPFDPLVPAGARLCLRTTGGGMATEDHAEHDGRIDCTTVIGAALMARQSFI